MVDPLAARFADVSPYNYVFGNPIIFIDPSGKAPEGWSDDNKDLANRFGVFGDGGDTYDGLFGNDQNSDPVDRFIKNSQKSKDGSHGDYETDDLRGSKYQLDFNKEIKNFANLIINGQAGVLTFEYRMETQLSDEYYWREKSWRKRIDELKAEALDFPHEVQTAVTQFYDRQNFSTGSAIHELQYDDFNTLYHKVRTELKKHGGRASKIEPRIWAYPPSNANTWRDPIREGRSGAYLFYDVPKT